MTLKQENLQLPVKQLVLFIWVQKEIFVPFVPLSQSKAPGSDTQTALAYNANTVYLW